jgi:cold shock CspA family protein
MAKSQQTFSKKEREKKKRKEKQEKQDKREEKKGQKGKSFEDMIAYVDEYGRFSSTPPVKKEAIKAEDIQVGIQRQEDRPAENSEHTGTVTFYNEGKGYGFIKDAADGQSIFFHISDLTGEVTEGNKVTFETARGPRGMVAVSVKLAQ